MKSEYEYEYSLNQEIEKEAVGKKKKEVRK